MANRQRAHEVSLYRFSSKQVLLIRNLYTKGNVTQSALAERFGMSTSNMKRILARRSWNTSDSPRPTPSLRIFEAQQRRA
jgi:DNA-binding MarR family transcriptional regulator